MSKQFKAEMARRHQRQLANHPVTRGRFDFFGTPATSSAAINSNTTSAITDPIENELKKHIGWPEGYPEQYKDDEHRIRIRYRETNLDQCADTLTQVVTMYTLDTLEKWRQTNGNLEFPYLEAYIQRDPTGETPWDLTDARIYRNAHKMATAGAASTTEDATGQSAAQPPPTTPTRTVETTHQSAETPLDSTATPATTTKATSKASDATATKPTGDMPASAAALATATSVVSSTSSSASSAPTDENNFAVETQFASILHKLHDKLYKIFRANMPKFICKQSKALLKEELRKWEKERGLKGLECLEKGKRYPWRKMGSWIVVNLGTPTLPSYYFLPLFTCIRKKDSTIAMWCQTIKDILWSIMDHNTQWGKVANVEAVSRLYAFTSNKERKVIGLHIQLNHKAKLGAGTIRGWLDKAELEEVISVIAEIDPTELPPGTTPRSIPRMHYAKP